MKKHFLVFVIILIIILLAFFIFLIFKLVKEDEQNTTNQNANSKKIIQVPLNSEKKEMHFGIGAGLPKNIYEVTKLGEIWLRHPGKGFSWYEVEPQKDTWNFEILDDKINSTKHNWIMPTYGMTGTVYPFGGFSKEYIENANDRKKILDHIKEHTVDMNDPVQKADAEIYIKQLVNRYKNKINYWELAGNEGLHSEGKLDIIKNTHEWIKQADPEAKTLVTAICGDTDKDFASNISTIDSLLDQGLGNYFDVANFHYYGHTGDDFEERLLERYNEYQNVLLKHNIDKPIWVTETGTCTDNPYISGKATEEIQAIDVIRRFVIFSAAGAEKVFWFNYGELNESDLFYGCNITKKPAYQTFQLIVEKIGYYKSVDIIENQNNNYIYKFTNSDDEIIIIAWSKSNATINLSDFFDNDRALLTNIDSTTEIQNTDNINISSSPIFIEKLTE